MAALPLLVPLSASSGVDLCEDRHAQISITAFLSRKTTSFVSRPFRVRHSISRISRPLVEFLSCRIKETLVFQRTGIVTIRGHQEARHESYEVIQHLCEHTNELDMPREVMNQIQPIHRVLQRSCSIAVTRTVSHFPKSSRQGLSRHAGTLGRSNGPVFASEACSSERQGSTFYPPHLMFDQVAKLIEGQIDCNAGRMTQPGWVANGTMRQANCTSAIRNIRSELHPVWSTCMPVQARVAATANNSERR